MAELGLKFGSENQHHFLKVNVLGKLRKSWPCEKNVQQNYIGFLKNGTTNNLIWLLIFIQDSRLGSSLDALRFTNLNIFLMSHASSSVLSSSTWRWHIL